MQALLEAQQKGETWQALGLAPAPHIHDTDGTVKVPVKWNDVLKRAVKELEPIKQ